MSEEPKSFWKKPRRGPVSYLLAWLAVMLVPFIIFVAVMLPTGMLPRGKDELRLLLVIEIAAALFLFLIWFIWWVHYWRNFRRFLFGSACAATLLALFYAEEDWRGWHRWNQFATEWEAKGEHFDMASVVPPPVPESQNFAMTPIAYTSYGSILMRDGKRIPYDQRPTNFIERMSMEIENSSYDEPTNGFGNWPRGIFGDLTAWQCYYRQAAAKTNDFPVPAQPGSPGADVLLALSKYDPVIEELRAASQLPDSRYPLDYDSESPAAILLPHLAPLKGSAQVLTLRSLAELHNGQPDQAAEDVRLGLELSGKIRTEPFLISHLVRIAMVRLMLQPIWEGLAEHKWSNAQLAALDAELAKLNFVADYQLGLHSELAMQGGEISLMRRHAGHLAEISGEFDGQTDTRMPDVPGVVAALIPNGWFYQNQYHCARAIEEYYLPVADPEKGTISPDLVREGRAAVDAEIKSPNAYNLLERLFLPGLANGAKHFADGQATVNLARTAIALERYRLAHGEYPETLKALAPQFIAQVPHDVIDGQPLKYSREADGLFVLSSRAWSQQDNGDARSRFEPNEISHQGDWVWKYPR